MSDKILKILIIGNAAGGKTVLSKSLSKIYDLPHTPVDSIQFLPGMIIRDLNETRKILNEITSQEKWLIDGFGPLDLLQKNILLADKIIFVDLPIWRNYLWALKRQFKSLWSKRIELPEGCNEATLSHTVKLFKTLWRIHSKMRPELLKIMSRDNIKHKTIHIRSMGQWKLVHKNGLGYISERKI
ncbi:MAG: flagellar protein FlaR [Oligoflexia bacterium]|nr:flagellar protein FlaR [Oligoflexia bacterium]